MKKLVFKSVKVILGASILVSFLVISIAIIFSLDYRFENTVVKVSGISGHGSGSIIQSSEDGSLILTNKHVCVGATVDAEKIRTIRQEAFMCFLKGDRKCVARLNFRYDKLMKPELSIGREVMISFNNLDLDDAEGVVLKISKSVDLCVIRIEEGDLPTIRIARYRARPMDPIISLSNPQDMTNHMTTGFVGDDMERENNTYTLHTAPIYVGSSGSPVVNIDGEMVGVTTLSTRLATQAYMIPLEDIILFLVEVDLRGK